MKVGDKVTHKKRVSFGVGKIMSFGNLKTERKNKRGAPICRRIAMVHWPHASSPQQTSEYVTELEACDGRGR